MSNHDGHASHAAPSLSTKILDMYTDARVKQRVGAGRCMNHSSCSSLQQEQGNTQAGTESDCIPGCCCRLPGLELRLRLLLSRDPAASAPIAPIAAAAGTAGFIGPAPMRMCLCFRRRFLKGPMLSRAFAFLKSVKGCRARCMRVKLLCIVFSSADRH